MHPRRVRDEKFLNVNAKDRIEGLLAIRVDTRKINRVERMCMIFRHRPAETDELHCSMPCVHAVTPGELSQLFELVETLPASTEELEEVNEAIQVVQPESDGAELPVDFRHASSAREDIENFRSLGLDFDDDDDDDDPVPENTPEPEDNDATLIPAPSNGLKADQAW